MKRKFLAMAILLSLALGLAAVPAAAETPTDLLLGTGDFETTNETIVWDHGMEVVTDLDGAYLAVPEDASEDVVYGTSVNVPVQPSAGYTLSFWVKCGGARSGGVLIRSHVDGLQYAEAETSGSILGDDINFSFGNTASSWREVKKSFITAPETTSILLQFYSQYKDGPNDLQMCLDNVKLTEGAENLLMNGEMNSFMGGTIDYTGGGTTTIEPMPDEWSLNVASDGGYNKLLEDPKAPGSGNMVYQQGKHSQLYMQNVPLAAGQYKMSFRYYGYYLDGHNGPVGGCVLQGNYAFYGSSDGVKPCFRQNIGPVLQSSAEQMVWMEYATYFTVPEDGYYAVGVGDRWSGSGHLYDDIVLVPAEENSVTYVHPQFASVATPPTVIHTDTGDLSYNVVGSISSMRGNVVDTISGGAQGSGVYNLTAIGHYLAKDVDATETFALVTAVYKKNKVTNSISLYSIKFEDGTSEPVINTVAEGCAKHNSENIILNFSVPAENDEYTYEVKSFIWSSISGMVPMSNVYELTY